MIQNAIRKQPGQNATLSIRRMRLHYLLAWAGVTVTRLDPAVFIVRFSNASFAQVHKFVFIFLLIWLEERAGRIE